MNTHDNLDHSFDSSDQLSLTDSTNSIAPIPVQRLAQTSIIENNCLFKSPKSSNQHQNYSPLKMENMFIGFKNGWGNNQIKVNQSKLKRARKFFEDDDDQNYGSNNTISIFNPINHFQPQNYHLKNEQFSMPCFKTMGKGLEIKVSSQAKLRAKNIFDGLQKMQSIKKPTKLKKQSKLVNESLVKTVSVQNKMKQNKASLKRVSFDFEEYQKQYKKQIQKSMILTSKSKNKQRISKKPQQLTSKKANKMYSYIKLCQLSILPQKEFLAFRQLSIDTGAIPHKIFTHYHQQCSVLQCLLCKISYTNEAFGLNQIYQLLNKSFCSQYLTLTLFQQLYSEVLFKLMKYTNYWPEIINKHSHPSNIIRQIHKKVIQLQKQPSSSYLQTIITQNKVGKKINVIVKDKYINSKMQIIFLKISDGWFSVWVAIQTKNILYNYLLDDRKIHIGSKLAICLWSFHPISNILDFNLKSNQSQSRQCIQFYFNGSIILKPNAKLGFTPQMFYRPLNKCRAKGGFIPVVQGIILRLFSLKEKIRNTKTQHNSYIHFAEILTPEGFTCFIKFILNEEESLVQYFRLYHSYFFYKLKINEQKNLLYQKQFTKFEEIKAHRISQKEMIYPEVIQRLLKNRLLNKNKLDNKNQIGQLWDIINNKGMVEMSDGKIFKLQIAGTTNMSDSNLLQQHRLIGIVNDSLCLEKQRFSSHSRRLPGIYTKLLKE